MPDTYTGNPTPSVGADPTTQPDEVAPYYLLPTDGDALDAEGVNRVFRPVANLLARVKASAGFIDRAKTWLKRQSFSVGLHVGPPPAWVGSTTYAVGARVLNDTARVYIATAGGVAAASGGPTGESTGIVDGTVTWDYEGKVLQVDSSAEVRGTLTVDSPSTDQPLLASTTPVSTRQLLKRFPVGTNRFLRMYATEEGGYEIVLNAAYSGGSAAWTRDNTINPVIRLTLNLGGFAISTVTAGTGTFVDAAFVVAAASNASTFSAVAGAFSGAVSGGSGTFSGALASASAAISGALTANTAAIAGKLTAAFIENLVGTGTGTNPGGTFANGTAATNTTRRPAITLSNGDISMVGVANPNSDTAVSNTVTPKNIIKAFGKITTNGSGGVTLNDGLNIASVALDTGSILVTFAAPFAASAYSVVVTTDTTFFNGSTSAVPVVFGTAAGTFKIELRNLDSNTQRSLSTTTATLYFQVAGAQ